MDTINTPILTFHSDTLEYVRKLFGLETLERRNDAVNIFKEWLKKQDHLIRKDYDREFIERKIVVSKGSVEKAKIKFDKLCSIKTLLPSFYEPFDLRKSRVLKLVKTAVLPKLTKEHYRVLIVKFTIQNYDSGLLEFYKYVIMICEYLHAKECCAGIVCVFDNFETDSMELMKNLNVMELRQIMTIVMEGYGAIIKGFHALSNSKTIEIPLAVFKQVVSAKIANRIHLHKTIETLHEHITPEILPMDYGGQDDTLHNLADNLLDEFGNEEFAQYFALMSAARTDESLRSAHSVTDHCSVPGSFRKLCVD